MPVPRYDELFNPLLAALKQLGGSANVTQIEAQVVSFLGLSESDAIEVHRGRMSKVAYRLHWARYYLKRYGLLINTDRGVWTLTDKGRSVGSVDPIHVKRYVNGLEHQEVDADPTTNDTMSFLDAAEQVLRVWGDRQPMHYRTIMQKALEQGLVRTSGKTPDTTLYAQILSDIDRRAKRGEGPRFLKVGKGLFNLAEREQHGPVAVIEQHNTAIRRKLRERLGAMNPVEFEALISQLLVAIGFEKVVVTARSNDGGIDVRGTLVIADVIRIRMAVQAKKWRHNVQRPIVQQVRGSLGTHDQGLVITTSDFSAGAREEAARADAVPVGLMNGDQLIASLVEHNLGVRRVPYDVLELGSIVSE